MGHYIKDRTRDAQFVIISLRNNMFELADRLVGIYKTDNSTKTVTINPAEFTVGGGGGMENDAPSAAAAGARKPQKALAGKGDDDVMMDNTAVATGGQHAVIVA